MSVESQGRKEVAEAVVQGVLIAALSAVCTGLINWQMEIVKAKAKAAEGEEKPKESA